MCVDIARARKTVKVRDAKEKVNGLLARMECGLDDAETSAPSMYM